MSGEVKRARKTGDPMTPEGAKARPVTPKRGGNITPEATKARFTGDPMSTSMEPAFVPRVITRPTPPAKTMTNPVK